MAISGHKIGGPMGIGALTPHEQRSSPPVLHGGGQERSVRSGTIDAPAIAGFAEAAAHVIEHLEEESIRIAALRNELIAAVQAVIHSSPERHRPNNRGLPGEKGCLRMLTYF